jgi:hypothetical protein
MRMGLWLAVIALLGCKKKDDPTTDTGADADTDTDTDSDTDTDADTDQPQGGQLRFAHAAEPFGTAELWVDGGASPALSMDPLQGTPWRQLPGGAHTFGVSAEGVPFDPTTDAKTDIQVTAGGRYTLVLMGTPEAPQLVAAEDNNGGLAAGGVRFNLINAAVGLATIDVWDATDEASAALDLAFGEGAPHDAAASDREFWVDTDDDGEWDFSYQVQAPGSPNSVVPLIFTYEGTELKLLAYSPGAVLANLSPVGLGGGDTGASTDTSPPDPPETADTGASLPETGDTGTSETGASTGDTGP